ncbi:hypothetical protein KUTeg_008219 [Tegillarca granosa]|uniref:carbonic anhydrase n=1 Tax=Tegillarca granosa TaxID=220873 RepID=A0ABQ9F8I6_TEGGR|nr:hypothetical protein KUTeg_008219 [Tegillarca granosa]
MHFFSIIIFICVFKLSDLSTIPKSKINPRTGRKETRYNFSYDNSLLLGMPNDIHFTLENIHIHFGKVLKPGSEHSINAKVYAGEIHLDHYNPEFPSFTEASSGNDPEALVTVAVLFEIDWTLGYHSNFDLFILKYISQVISPDTPPIPAPLKLSDLLPNSGDFFTYVVFVSPFTCLKDIRDTPISKFGNSRPAQPVGRRIVEANFKRAPINTET